MRVATDIGGTFTDLVYSDGGTLGYVKTDTVLGDFEAGVFAALAAARISADAIGYFVHGSTVAINTLTERKGARTGLITTAGFRDVLEIGRGNTPDLFNINYRKPAPFVRRRFRREVDERINYLGELEAPLNTAQLDAVVDDFRAAGIEAIAVCFLHSYANASNELEAVARIKERWPRIHVVASHQVCTEWREYERTSTVVASAYVLPRTAAYLDRLATKLRSAGHDASPFIMQSNGGVTTVAAAKRNPICLVESGPASGVLGVAALGRLMGESNLLALDIGGTTAKCALLAAGEPKITTSYDIERSSVSPGYPIRTPVIDLVEIGNGGGSVAWLDTAGSLNVGPHSAGSTPGPVAYGKGGVQPTTTDANLLLGRINPRRFGQSQSAVDLGAIDAAFAALAASLGVASMDVARGVVRIANANMVNALKLVSLNRGHDPREFKLVAFGGGGPMHACALARELHIPEVIVPAYASVFSAWGMLMVDLRRDYVRTAVVELCGANTQRIHESFRNLRRQAAEEFAQDGYAAGRLMFRSQLDARYRGQEHTVSVVLPDIPESDPVDAASIVDRFHASHEAAYGFRLGNPVEIVNFHLACFAMVDKPDLPRLRRRHSDATAALVEVRTVDFLEQSRFETPIYDRARLALGMRIVGPAVIEEPTTVTVVHPGDRLQIDEFGCLRIAIDAVGKEQTPCN